MTIFIYSVVYYPELKNNSLRKFHRCLQNHKHELRQLFYLTNQLEQNLLEKFYTKLEKKIGIAYDLVLLGFPLPNLAISLIKSKHSRFIACLQIEKYLKRRNVKDQQVKKQSSQSIDQSNV